MRKELESIKLKEIKEYRDYYNDIIEFELDNGEFALINLYMTNIDDRDSYSPENFIILKESIIEMIKNEDDTLWENLDKYWLHNEELDETQERFDKELYNDYRDLIIKLLEENKNFTI